MFHPESEIAVQIATELIIHLDKPGTPINIAQAALGNAWFRVCRAMEFPEEVFEEMLKEVIHQFKEKKNGQREME